MVEIFVTERDERTMKGLYDYFTGKSKSMPLEGEAEAEAMLHRFLVNFDFAHKAEERDRKMQSRGETPKEKEVWYDIPAKLNIHGNTVTTRESYQVSNLGRVRSKNTGKLKKITYNPKTCGRVCVFCKDCNGANRSVIVQVDKLVYSACTDDWSILSLRKKNLFEHINGDLHDHSFTNLKLIKKC
jgi:hypothetical protein